MLHRPGTGGSAPAEKSGADPGQAAPDEEIEVVQRCGPDIDQNIPRTRGGLIELPEAQDLGTTVLFEIDRFHSPP